MPDKIIKIKAKMDGKMDDGEFFCYNNENYEAIFLDDPDPDNQFYYVRSEGDIAKKGIYYKTDNQDGFNHGMDADFFNEYFEIIKDN